MTKSLNTLTKNNNQVQYNYRDSGIRGEQFYRPERISTERFDQLQDEGLLTFSLPLFKKYLMPDNPDADLSEVAAVANETLLYWATYYRPEHFNEEIAYKCGLFPFRAVMDKNDYAYTYLALTGCGMDLSPCLDAHQALVDGTIDPSSKYFTEPSYFQHVVGKEIMAEVTKAITNQ